MSRWMQTPQEHQNKNLGELFAKECNKALSGEQPAILTENDRITGQTPKVASPSQDICANRHGGNPESRKAFQSIKDRLTERQMDVFAVIQQSAKGMTVDELAISLHTTPNAISGRVSELKRMGKIKKQGTRKTRSGNSAAVLVAV